MGTGGQRLGRENRRLAAAYSVAARGDGPPWRGEKKSHICRVRSKGLLGEAPGKGLGIGVVHDVICTAARQPLQRRHHVWTFQEETERRGGRARPRRPGRFGGDQGPARPRFCGKTAAAACRATSGYPGQDRAQIQGRAKPDSGFPDCGFPDSGTDIAASTGRSDRAPGTADQTCTSRPQTKYREPSGGNGSAERCAIRNPCAIAATPAPRRSGRQPG